MSTVPLNVLPASAPDNSRAMSTSARAWALYQGGRDPYITLISIYVFMPYVATVLIGNAVKGQAMIAAYSFFGGLVAALTAPLLGAAADRMGRRLPPLFILSLLFAPLVAALWWGQAGRRGLERADHPGADPVDLARLHLRRGAAQRDDFVFGAQRA